MNPQRRHNVTEDVTRARDALDAMDAALDRAHDVLDYIHARTADEDHDERP